jgi:hypothetical protein
VRLAPPAEVTRGIPRASIPTGCHGEAALASAAADFIIGQALTVDGGRSNH